MAYVERKDNKINVLFVILLITVMVFTLFIAPINVWAASKDGDGDGNGNHYGQHKDHSNRGTHKPIKTTPPPTVEATP